MSSSQAREPIRDSLFNPAQSHGPREHSTSNLFDSELGFQQPLEPAEDSHSAGIALAQMDRKDSVRGQQSVDRRQSTKIANANNQQDEERRSEHTMQVQGINGAEKREEEQQDEDAPDSAAVKRSAFRNHISNFQWQWFACTMSTGGVGIMLSETPHQFRGLQTIGKIFFILELVLFVVFTCAIGLRFILDKKALKRSLLDPTESFFFGCFWLSQATIIANIQRYAVVSTGPWLIKALEVLVWYYAGCATLVAIFMYPAHFSRHDLSIKQVQPSWVLSIYPVMLTGTITSLLASSQPTNSALPMIIGGIAFQGLGFMFSFMLITIFIWRCFAVGLPPAQMRVGMFIVVGAPGYTATALQGLATAATKHFPPGYMGVETVPAADVLVVLSIAVGAFLWLLSFAFFAWSVVSVALDMKNMKFDITWWACIFPNVGWVVATSLLGQELNSSGVQWVASAMTIILVIFWLFVAASHLKAIFQGRSPPRS